MAKLLLRCRDWVTLLAVIALGLWVASPLLTPRLPLATDSLFHLYTLTQLDYLIQQGIFFTPWFPYQASGFGLPLFQYHPPLAFYVAELFKLLGFETLSALRLALGLTLVGGALGMYLWVKDVLKDGSSALAAATAYVCGPYMLYNAFFRGGLMEQFALMLMPLTLWAFHRLAVCRQGRYLAASTLGYAALVLAHSLTAFAFSPVLLVYTMVLTSDNVQQTGSGKTSFNFKMWLILWSGVGLGLGLSAFYWVPALAERNSIADFLRYTPDLDYHLNFLSLNALFTWPFTTMVRPSLSPIALGLAVLGLFGLSQCRPAVKKQAIFAVMAALGCAAMALPLAVGVWETVPLLRFFQFPHRFLGVTSVFVAFLVGVGVYNLRRKLEYGLPTICGKVWPPTLLFYRWGLPVVMLCIIGLLMSQTWILTKMQYYPTLPEINVNFIMQKEREAGQIGTLYIANFMPTTVKILPPYEMLAHDGPERFDLTSLPSEATLLIATYRPLRYDLTLSSPKPFTARFNTFYFPGWQAQLDGQPIPLAPTDPYGLISVEVPAGQHQLTVWFGSTPVRTLASFLSMVTAAVLGVVSVNIIKYQS